MKAISSRQRTKSMTYTRNVQGKEVKLELTEVDPRLVRLDPTNPRIRSAMDQLPPKDRNDAACTLILTAQEETESLKVSIMRSGGVQEPIYVRHDNRVAEGNRRVVAARMALEECPHDRRFASIPAWRVPKGTPETIVQDLLNEIHIGSVRGWAPYEKAMQVRSLVREDHLIVDEVAERYRLTSGQVQQMIAAADFMDHEFFTIVDDPSDPEHRSKYSYFLEFEKNRKIRALVEKEPDLRAEFAHWVRDQKINKGIQVRSLPKILTNSEAKRLLKSRGFKSAKEYISKQDPTEHDLYSQALELIERLGEMDLDELDALRGSPDQKEILRDLRDRLQRTLTLAK